MVEVIIDYEKAVLTQYHEKRKANLLRSDLAHPAPAKLKDCCLMVFKERYDSTDRKILVDFFEVGVNEQMTWEIIDQFNRDRFRPLVKYLKGEINKTDLKNTELLAWLIDFRPRPFDLARGRVIPDWSIGERKVEATDAENRLATVQEPIASGEKINKVSFFRRLDNKPHFKWIRVIVIMLIVLIVAAMWYYGWRENENSRYNAAGLQRCMYWAEDHYVQVSCNQKFGADTIAVAFDSARFYQLKRITRPDTITLNAIGKVWYIKRNNKYEFYTSGGYYPADPKSRLRPVTEFIIQNRISKQ